MKLIFHITTKDGAALPEQIWNEAITSMNGTLVQKWRQRIARCGYQNGAAPVTVTTMRDPKTGLWFVSTGDVVTLPECRVRATIDMEHDTSPLNYQAVEKLVLGDLTEQVCRFYRDKFNVQSWKLTIEQKELSNG